MIVPLLISELLWFTASLEFPSTVYTVLPSVFSTIPTWSEVPSPFQSKKIRVPGAGEYPQLFHFPLLWNHAIPSSHRENFGILPLSISPA